MIPISDNLRAYAELADKVDKYIERGISVVADLQADAFLLNGGLAVKKPQYIHFYLVLKERIRGASKSENLGGLI